MAIRTTISAVYWTDDVEEANAIVDQVREALPEDAQDTTLTTIEYLERPPDPLPSGSNGG